MARIDIKFPEKQIFQTNIEVQISHINYGGHLGNDSILSLCHEARIRFLEFLDKNFSEMNIENIGIIMSDAAIIFKKEIFRGDKIRIEIGVDDITNCALDIYYRIIDEESEKEAARIKTGIVFFNYQKRSIVPIPNRFIEILKTYM